MNNRLRQRMIAESMLDKHDPIIIAGVKCEYEKFSRCLVFRMSEYAQYKERYGDDLKVICSDV